MNSAGKMLCPVCGLGNGRLFYEIPDRSPLALSPISIVSCSKCGHRFLMNPPVNKLQEFYANDKNCYAFHQSDSYVNKEDR